MPLHLLGKKSWNVYNQDSIARVRRDEDAAAAREAAEEQSVQESNARRRMRMLRGETSSDEYESRSREDRKLDTSQDHIGQELGLEITYSDAQRNRKRRRGEDDTDRDIRHAKRTIEPRQLLQNSGAQVMRELKPIPDNTVLEDHKGNFNLFPREQITDPSGLRESQDYNNEQRRKKRRGDERVSY